MSNISSASNRERSKVTVRPEFEDGPFVYHPENYDAPPSYILTKTHCEGYCDDCPPERFVMTIDSFEKECRTARKYNITTGRYYKVVYNSSVPKRAVHLLRNPFDNLVARLHLAVKRRHDLGWTEEQLSPFSNSREGLLAWCDFIDKKNEKKIKRTPLITSGIKKLFIGLPCAAEWYRYVQWHNLAIETTQRLHLPTHVLYYENYTDHFDETVSELLNFLELPSVSNPKSFIPGKTYLHFFSEDEARAAAELVRALASVDCWKLISHYFHQWQETSV